MNKLKKNEGLQKVQDVKEVKQIVHLIRAPSACIEQLGNKMVQILQQDVDMEVVPENFTVWDHFYECIGKSPLET